MHAPITYYTKLTEISAVAAEVVAPTHGHRRHFADVESLLFKVKMTHFKVVPLADSLRHFSFVLIVL